jgi:hypothetical protein
MSEQDQPSTSIGVSYQDRLPVAWRVLNEPLTDAERIKLDARNEDVLRIVLSLDEPLSESGEEGPAHGEIQRLDFKLNLILDLVSQIFSRHAALPEHARITLAGQWLEWTAARSIPVGTTLALDIYLHDKYPQPVVLMGDVVSVSAAEEGGYTVRIDLMPVGESTQDVFEKFVFRQHRRAVALSRRQIKQTS